MFEAIRASQKVPIHDQMVEWVPNVDAVLPIQPTDIPYFGAWIAWNGFTLDRSSGRGHDGYDFATYFTTQNHIVFGLPPQTKIRAIADGVVTKCLPEYWGTPYYGYVEIEHGKPGEGMVSHYGHVVGEVIPGQTIKRGDCLGHLYADPPGDVGRLVHLHFALKSANGTRGTSRLGAGFNQLMDDPGYIDMSIYTYKVVQEHTLPIQLLDRPNLPVVINNFQNVRIP